MRPITLPALPMDQALPQVLDSLKKSNALVISAEPGAGKTTRLPPALIDFLPKKILVLEPRRIAAISAAQRIAEENGWNLGAEVGYQVRFEKKVTAHTKIIFLTEALLLRMMVSDPELKDVSCVILDEFHERSVHIDLALGALNELQELSRPDLKIIVMSATLDIEPLVQFLQAQLVSVPGKVFPLEIRYEKKPQLIQSNFAFTERMTLLIKRALMETKGDLLCFFPGRGEIDRVYNVLEQNVGASIELRVLHGQLALPEQRRALSKSEKRRVILATNVAESSLTVEGVTVVVDSGLSRILQLHPRTGYESMDLVRISKASAKQRAGRAARNAPGIVYRAWIPIDELSMKEFETPEIHRLDLSETILLLSGMGISQPESFSWFEAPKSKAISQAQLFLRSIEAIDELGQITHIGKSLRKFPLHPRLAKLLWYGAELKCNTLACELAALLSNPIQSAKEYENENDLLEPLQAWRQNRNNSEFRNLEKAFRNLIELSSEHDSKSDIDMEIILLSAFSDRLCKRRKENDPQAKMVGGRGIKLHPDSNVKKSEYFLALELKEGRDNSEALVFKAIGLDFDLVKKYFEKLAQKKISLEWDDENGRFWAIESLDYLGVAIGTEHRRPAAPVEVEGKLSSYIVENWHKLLVANSDLSAWFDRLFFLHQAGKFPLMDGDQIAKGVEFASLGESTFAGVAKKNLIPFFESQLLPDHLTTLKRDCPEFWVVPSGSQMKIQYSKEQGPQVEVRLQELFGLPEAPKIAGQALTLVLLAPNFRPVQVTRDLSSFWKSGYFEVRKELKIRYPKHSWPEDPLTAAPQAKGRSVKRD